MKLSLRSLIAIPLIGQVIAITAATGWLAHRHGQKSVDTLAYHLLAETGEHFQHKLTTYTAIPPLVTQENRDLLDLQALDKNNLDSWFPYFFRQAQRFPDVTYIYYGDTNGRYVELNKLPDGRLEFAIKDDPKAELVNVFPVSPEGRLQSGHLQQPYDPRQRPWYRTANQHRQDRWTSVYDFEDPSPILGISFVRPHLGDDETLQGVFGADFTLDAITTFLERVQTSHSSAMFLMDTEGRVLSNVSQAAAPEDHQTLSSTALSPADPLIQTAVDYTLQKLATSGPIQTEQQFKFRSNHADYWVQITPFSDDYNLRWLGVSLLPESKFTQQLQANSRNTALLCVLAMGISSGISWLIAQWINRPVYRLGRATQAIIKGEAQCIMPSPIQELNVLIDSFNHMEDDLTASRSQLQTYSHQLEDLVNQRTQALRRSEATFAAAFQASPNAITLSTIEEGRYLKVNDRFVELMGVSKDDILGRTSTELDVWVAPKTRDIFYQELINGRLRNQEWTVRNPLGEIKTVLLSAEIIHFQQDACVLVIINDISDRIAEQEQLRQNEATIRQQEQFLRSIYNGVEAGIFVIDVLGYQTFRYVDSNTTVERLSGASRQVLLNSTPEDLFSPEVAIELVQKYLPVQFK